MPDHLSTAIVYWHASVVRSLRLASVLLISIQGIHSAVAQLIPSLPVERWTDLGGGTMRVEEWGDLDATGQVQFIGSATVLPINTFEVSQATLTAISGKLIVAVPVWEIGPLPDLFSLSATKYARTSSGIPIVEYYIVSARPSDLVAPTLSLTPSTVVEGQLLTAQLTIRNDGPSWSAASRARMFLSPGNDFSTSDDSPFGMAADVPVLGPGNTHVASFSSPMPNLGSGSYQVWTLAELDFEQKVTESNESNLYKRTTALPVSDSAGPANDTFANATVISGSAVKLNSTNVLATKETSEPNHAGYTGGRSVWWKWVAPFSGEVGVSTIESAFDTLLAVYTGSTVGALTTVASDANGGGDYTSALRFNATAGTTYLIAVDGYASASGDMTLTLVLTTPYTISTLAGAPGISGTVDGLAANARFNRPWGLVIDDAGNIFVADTLNHAIRKISATGEVTTFAGLLGVSGGIDGAGNVARFNYPRGLSIDAAANIYVADTSNHTVRKITRDGVVTTLAGSAGVAGGNDGNGAAARFDEPWSLVVDTTGNIFVTEPNDHVIRKITPTRDVSTFAGARGTSGRTDGALSVARFNSPHDVAVDSVGNIYVTDRGNHSIRKIDATGVVSTLAGLSGQAGKADGIGSTARFDYPLGITVDLAGNIYVAALTDSAGPVDVNTIRRITPTGVVSTLAGLAGVVGSANGTGSTARFNGPCRVSVDSVGTIYIADFYNHTIRKGVPASFHSRGDVALTVSGPASVGAGSTTEYRAFLTGDDGVPREASQRAVFSMIPPAPAGASILGSTLTVARSAPTGTAQIRASYEDVTGRIVSQPFAVTIAPVFFASMSTSARFISGTTYEVTVDGSASGGTPLYTFRWDTNHDGSYDDLVGANRTFTISSTGGTMQIALEVVDAGGAKAYARRNLTVNKPAVVNEPFTPPVEDVVNGRILDQLGKDFSFLDSRSKNGLLLITHGLHSSGSDAWIVEMARRANTRLTNDTSIGGEAPNIAILDWASGADPGGLVDPRKLEILRALDKLYSSLSLWQAAKFGFAEVASTAAFDAISPGSDDIALGLDFLVDVLYIRPAATTQGQLLAQWMWQNAKGTEPRINPDYPIHLVGHSAGGFVVGECASWLRQHPLPNGKTLFVDRVTMLDTPFPVRAHLSNLTTPANGPVVERFISSNYGGWEFPNTWLLGPTSRRRANYLGTFWNWRFGPGETGHGLSYVWYRHTILSDWGDDSNTLDGFNVLGFELSPFAGGYKVPRGVGTSNPVQTQLQMPQTAVAMSVTDFSLFGGVTSNTAGYTMSEQANAGIWKDVTIPLGAESLRFDFWFSGAGDGDFLCVQFGDRSLLYVGLDTELSRSGFTAVEVPLDGLSGSEGALVFKLISRGAPNAVLELRNVGFVVDDDADHDGLSISLELELSSDPDAYDTDRDGFDDGYEVGTSHTDPLLADTDADGQPDRAESIAGTDPLSSSSAFRLTDISYTAGTVTLRWTAKIGRTYQVLRSSTVDFASFDVIAGSISGVEPITTYLDATAGAAAQSTLFYKIRLQAAGPPIDSNIATAMIGAGGQSIAFVSSQTHAASRFAGEPLTLGVTATGSGITYQWQIVPAGSGQWMDIAGATGATYTLSSLQRFNAGSYRVVVTANGVSATTDPVVVTVVAPPPSNARLMNLSTRALSETGDGLLIPGFVITGSGTKRVLIRGIGPTLGSFGVGGTLADPQMTLKVGATTVAANDDWGTNANKALIISTSATVGAFGLLDGSKDAALLLDLAAGAYTVPTSGVAGGTGIGMVELYDADPGSPGTRLVNISNRGFVGIGDAVMIPGIVVSNEGSRTFLIRAVGPTLAGFGVSGTLADPVLTVFKGNAPILVNDDWGNGSSDTATVAATVGAFPLAIGSKDAAFVVTLPPGPYTIQATGKSGTTGIALVEVYLVP